VTDRLPIAEKMEEDGRGTVEIYEIKRYIELKPRKAPSSDGIKAEIY